MDYLTYLWFPVLIAIIWMFCWPFFSVVLWKEPRSLYIDEASIQYISQYHHDSLKDISYQHFEVTSIRSPVQELCSQLHCKIDLNITFIVFDNPLAIQEDVVLLVFPYESEVNEVIVCELVAALRHEIMEANWIAKHFAALLIPQMQNLESWLHLYHETELNQGIIREAYVIDTTSISNLSTVDSAILSSIGVNGQQANMDMISAIVKYRYFPVFHENHFHFNQQVQLNWQLRYINNFKSLCKHFLMTLQGTSGLHGLFLQRNIDSITLTLQSKSHKLKSTTKIRKDISRVTSFCMMLVRLSNSLEEELHHSHFYYLPMQSTYFVSFDEYLLVLGLLMMPLFATFFYFSNQITCKGRSVEVIYNQLLVYLVELCLLFSFLIIEICTKDHIICIFGYVLGMIVLRKLVKHDLDKGTIEVYVAINSLGVIVFSVAIGVQFFALSAIMSLIYSIFCYILLLQWGYKRLLYLNIIFIGSLILLYITLGDISLQFIKWSQEGSFVYPYLLVCLHHALCVNNRVIKYLNNRVKT